MPQLVVLVAAASQSKLLMLQVTAWMLLWETALHLACIQALLSLLALLLLQTPETCQKLQMVLLLRLWLQRRFCYY
jgi:hypothetical protein